MLIVHRCLLGLDANWAPRVAGTLVQDRWRSNDANCLLTGQALHPGGKRSGLDVSGFYLDRDFSYGSCGGARFHTAGAARAPMLLTVRESDLSAAVIQS